MKGHLFCFGLGYVGEALALQAIKHGWRVSGTTRSKKKIERFRSVGIEAFHYVECEAASQQMMRSLKEATHVIDTIQPSRNWPDSAYRMIVNGALSNDVRWIGFLSSAAVYGSTAGKVVDETAQLKPGIDVEVTRVLREKNWMALHDKAGLPVHVFRPAAIYGPGRNQLAWVRAGRKEMVYAPGVLFNRIHIDDLALALLRSMEEPQPGEFFNLADDVPAEPMEVSYYACKLLDVQPGPVIDLNDSDLPYEVRCFYDHNHVVTADKIKQNLGISWKYPSYREGLLKLFQDGQVGQDNRWS